LDKRCVCGESMEIRLRTVIFSGKVSIENVPVYSCSSCERSIVYPDVKLELTKLIRSLGANPERKRLYFNELNELAHLLYEVTLKEKRHVPVEQIIGERVNELLDLLLLAQSLGDDEWVRDIRERLAQVTNRSIATYLL